MSRKKNYVRVLSIILTLSILLSTGIAYAFAEDLTSAKMRNSQIVSATSVGYTPKMTRYSTYYGCAVPDATSGGYVYYCASDGWFRRLRTSYRVL